MVALDLPAVATASARSRDIGWTLGAGVALLIGVLARLALGGLGVGDISAAVLSVLLASGAWTAARLLAGPRAAFVASVVLLALFDLAALPSRTPPIYDDLQAFYRTDQELTAQLMVPAIDQTPALTLVAQPVFSGPQSAFGLAATIDASPVSWRCAFERGLQRLILPLTPGATVPGQTANVALHLTGAPTRESDYLIVYSSSRLGGFLLSLEPAFANTIQSSTTCSLA